MLIEKYSFGTGDRFGRQGAAQLAAIMEMNRLGVPVVPVWNKSNREHHYIGSSPAAVPEIVRQAVSEAGYAGRYHIDADHVQIDTIDKFVPHCDFFTLDVARHIGEPYDASGMHEFLHATRKFRGDFTLPVTGEVFRVTDEYLGEVARKYLKAMSEVGKMYRYLRQVKGEGWFITEVSVDESDEVQSPVDLFFILAMLRVYDVEVQTLAPRFPGLLAKGIDYVGNVSGFMRAFEQNVAVVIRAQQEFALPASLKLSIHTGSDKFSLYPGMGAVIRKHNAGIHLKTAGTTWLEEVAGLALSGGAGLDMAKDIYRRSFAQYRELAQPYAGLLFFDPEMLPPVETVDSWNAEAFAAAITHDPANPAYNMHFRQLIHIGYRNAADKGEEYLHALDKNREVVAARVTHNLLSRHMKPLFLT
jgi:hypothetical protein